LTVSWALLFLRFRRRKLIGLGARFRVEFFGTLLDGVVERPEERLHTPLDFASQSVLQLQEVRVSEGKGAQDRRLVVLREEKREVRQEVRDDLTREKEKQRFHDRREEGDRKYRIQDP
jgi:hypothetical protein